MNGIRKRLYAAKLRRHIKQGRKAHGLSTDLKTMVEKYRACCPEYADELEKAIYPRPGTSAD